MIVKKLKSSISSISKLSFYEIILKLIKSILEQDEEFKENSTHDSI